VCSSDLEYRAFDVEPRAGGADLSLIVEDALDEAIPAVAQGIFYNQGQICAAGSRLYVERSVFDLVANGVADHARNMRLGAGLDPGAELGPLVSAGQRERVLRYVHEGIASGARVMSGGSAPARAGFFVEPTVLTDVRPEMSVVREEIFGPVIVALPFDDEDELVNAVNDTRDGLSASIYASDIGRVHRLIPRIRAGSVFVNGPARTDANLPLGGMKESGIGREHGASMVDLYTELKSVMIRYQDRA